MNMEEYVALKHEYSFEFNDIDCWEKLDRAIAWNEFDAALEEFAENDKADSPHYGNNGRDLMDISTDDARAIIERYIERITEVGTEVMRNEILNRTGIYC